MTATPLFTQFYTIALLLGPLLGFTITFMYSMFILSPTSRKQGLHLAAAERPFVRRVLHGVQWIVLMVAFVVYVRALFEPASKKDWGWFFNTGLNPLFWDFPFWTLNLCFIASPFLLCLIILTRDTAVQLMVSTVQLGCAIAVNCIAYSNEQRTPTTEGFSPGGIHWSDAFWIVLIAYAIPAVHIGKIVNKTAPKPRPRVHPEIPPSLPHPLDRHPAP